MKIRTITFWLVSLFLIFLPLEALSKNKTGKIKINAVNIDGNVAFPDRRINRIIISHPSRFLAPSYYYPQVLVDDISNLELVYRQNGYLDARVLDYSVIIDSVRHRAHINIKVFEGDPTIVEGVSVFENKVFTDQQILERITIKSGNPLLRGKIDESTKSILTYCAENGYLDASVNPEIRVDSLVHRAIIDYRVHENTQYSIGNIHINGLDKTRNSVINRELIFKPGEIVNYTKLLQSQRNSYMTGLFQSVYIRPIIAESGNNTEKDILVEVKENLSREYNVSVGYGSVERIRTRAEVYNTNWRGSAQKLGLSGSLSFVNRRLEFSFTEPWTFNTRWRTDLTTQADYQKQTSYDLSTVGGKLSLGRAIEKRISTTVSYRHENSDLSNITVTAMPENVASRIRSLIFNTVFDTRDNFFNTKNGIYIEPSVEIAGLFIPSVDSFTKIIFKAKRFHSVNNDLILASSIELGTISSKGGLDGVPLQERFYAGGPNSLRGFGNRKVGPLDANRTPIGGAYELIWNAVELRQSVYKMVGVAAFLDLGNVWSNRKDIRLEDVRVSPGLGLRVNTFLGLLRLDYGFNVDPRIGENQGMLYFSVGHAI